MPIDSRYTSGTYAATNPTWHGERADWKATQVQRMLEAHDMQPGLMVDVGCGTGGVLRELAVHHPGAVLRGYEPAAAAAAAAAPDADTLASSRVEILDAELADVPGGADVLLMLDVFEHVEDYLGFLRQATGRARYYVFHIPLDLSVQSLLRGSPLTRVRARLGHLHYFTADTATATLEHAGFRVLDRFYTGGSYEGPGRSRQQRAAGALRRRALRASPALAARVLGGFSLLVLAEDADPLTPR